jgi:8-oxo-dGTP diphosphatase
MPHIHELYDWVVSIFIVHLPAGRQAAPRVLLAFHRKYNEWLPVGGHVDLDEDPEQALFKEIKEECGLKVRVLSSRPPVAHRGVKPILTPSYVDVHRIKGKHKHIALIYFGVSKSGRVKLEAREFTEYRWLSASELSDPALKLTRSIFFYSRKALEAAARSR